MPVASSVYNLCLVAIVVILLTTLAVTVTVKTGLGSLLALLLVLVAAAYVAGILWNTRLLADPTAYLASHPFGGLGPALTIAMDLGLFGITGVAALVAAALGRRWRWFAGIFAALLPMAALALGGMLPTDPLRYAHNIVPFSVALFCPLLVSLAFALSQRRARPAADSSGS
jgi:hypothetical protein